MDVENSPMGANEERISQQSRSFETAHDTPQDLDYGVSSFDLKELYPYDTHPSYNPLSWVFFNAAGLRIPVETCSALADHVFTSLGCGHPGTAGVPTVKYDALGTSGAPWDDGEWIGIDQERASINATAPSVSVSEMSPQQRAELRAALDAVEFGVTLDLYSHSDENPGGK